MKRKRLKVKRINTIKALYDLKTESFRNFTEAVAMSEKSGIKIKKLIICPSDDLYVIVHKSDTIGDDETKRDDDTD
jgi:hypothetical protein